MQHAWATAVETVGTMLSRALKASEGEEEWLRFFALTSTVFAAEEDSPPVPDMPANGAAIAEVQREAQRLRVRERLRAYRAAVDMLEHEQYRGAPYFLLSLDPAQERLDITGFGSGALEQATAAYLERESDTADSPGAEVVLVRSESLESLRRAYPNYFLDTELFLMQLDEVTGAV
jgi:hypothetical protein